MMSYIIGGADAYMASFGVHHKELFGPIFYKPLQMSLDPYKLSQNLLSLVCHQDAISYLSMPSPLDCR
jgi:hypothetical protein